MLIILIHVEDNKYFSKFIDYHINKIGFILIRNGLALISFMAWQVGNKVKSPDIKSEVDSPDKKTPVKIKIKKKAEVKTPEKGLKSNANQRPTKEIKITACKKPNYNLHNELYVLILIFFTL